ncbi:MAG: acyl-CoA dehydrogenase [Candidatus Abyssobacteria bacterium SURF_17]|uniref:Acyl-CoA dehydrogenase n=1 Tax=Candidatus Abyssobacteria bacterium SURF_17 TaxID=2093361 RepID=A0A419EQA4_9BACT|nr:MAG: acyl-CoA dehydrogenase [Candidatus Abyssubacteria bacterium SURF_17]
MNYDLTEEQSMLRESAHKFLADECSSELVRELVKDEKGFKRDLWQKMAELGWMGLPIPEKYGGSGMTFLELVVLLSEMGYYCLPGPFFSTVVLGGLTLIEAGNEKQKAEILSGLAEGSRILTLAWLEQAGTYTPSAIKLAAKLQDGQYILSGTKLFVPDAHVADTIICVARTGVEPEDVTLFLVDAKSAGIKIALLDTLAGDKQCEVIFDKVAVPRSNLLGDVDNGWPILKKVLLMSAVAKSAEMVGAAQKVLEMAVEYAKVRTQFGRPIGAFQAVQHHCANMLTYADTVKYMMYGAAWKIASGLPFEKEASMCKAWVSDSHRKLVALGHQVMGGIGFMEEHDLQLYFKRAKAAEQMFGDADFHRELVAREMGL